MKLFDLPNFRKEACRFDLISISLVCRTNDLNPWHLHGKENNLNHTEVSNSFTRHAQLGHEYLDFRAVEAS